MQSRLVSAVDVGVYRLKQSGVELLRVILTKRV